MLFLISVKFCDAAAAATGADFECHKDGLCTGGWWCRGGEIGGRILTYKQWEFHFSLRYCFYLVWFQKSPAAARWNITPIECWWEKTGKQIFAKKIKIIKYANHYYSVFYLNSWMISCWFVHVMLWILSSGRGKLQYSSASGRFINIIRVI